MQLPREVASILELQVIRIVNKRIINKGNNNGINISPRGQINHRFNWECL